MRILLFFLVFLFLTGCSSSNSNTGGTSKQKSISQTQAIPKLILKGHTPAHGDAGDFFIRGEAEVGEVKKGDTIDLIEKGGRRFPIVVKSILDSEGNNTKAEKGKWVTMYFDGDATLYDGIAQDVYLVEKGGSYPVDSVSTGPVQLGGGILKGKINGTDWEGISRLELPSYNKFGGRINGSSDRPVLRLNFQRESDRSSVNIDLIGMLKMDTYSNERLLINYNDSSDIKIHKPTERDSNITVEITSYSEFGNTAIISGKIIGVLGEKDQGQTTLNLEWKDMRIHILGTEAK